jgi:1,4-dihydroxy-2-naphthoyl-CoA hydrolase
MEDTDMAGILYFAKQFRFAHEALEDFAASEGFDLHRVFTEEAFVFVIVHAEADYYAPVRVGEELEVDLSLEKIGNSSFTIGYKIYGKNRIKVGAAKTVHVTLDSESRKKITIPQKFRNALEKHFDKK